MDQKLKIVFACAVLAVFTIFMATPLQTQALYESKSSVIAKFKTLCNSHSNWASYVSLGKTTQGRDIWIFRIGNPKGPAIMWDAQLHGGEDLGSEVELLIAKWLLESNDPTAKSILVKDYVLFVPVVDVDTFARTNTHGVNLNRNFAYRWGTTGSSSPSSTEYRGPYAASEKETQALRNAFKTYQPKFYVNTHMWGGPRLFYSSGDSTTLVNTVKAKIAQISSQRKVTPYSTTQLSGGGFAISDAAYLFKACAWLLEINGPTTPSYATLAANYYPKCLPIFIVLCQLA